MERLRNIYYRGISSVTAAALILGAAHFLSRVLGMVRDRLLAGHFGASRELDMYYAAFQIPDFMSTLFLLGAGANAILPVFQEYLSRSREDARQLIDDTVTIFLIGSCLVSFCMMVAAPFVVSVVAPGFNVSERVHMVVLVRIMLLSPILLGLSSILSSVIQSFQLFFAYSLAPILYNIGIIIGIGIFLPVWGIPGLAVGVVIGALLHMSIQWVSLRMIGFTPRLVWPHFSEGLKKIWRLSLPRVFSVSLTQLTVMVLVAVGSTLASGSIAVFQLSQNLYFFPIGIFGVSFATAVFPRLNQAYIARDGDLFFRDLFTSIRSILFWLAPIAVVSIVLRAHLIRVAFGAGLFSWNDTRLTAASFAILAVVMVWGGMTALLIKGFYALENTWIPLAVTVGTSVLSIIGAVVATKLFLISPFFTLFITRVLRISDVVHPEAVGLACGFSIGVFFDTWLLYKLLKWYAYRTFHINRSISVKDILVIIISALASGATAYAVRVLFSSTLVLTTFMRVLGEGVLIGAVGFCIYGVLVWMMGNPDIRTLGEAFHRRFFKISSLPPNWNGEESHPDH